MVMDGSQSVSCRSSLWAIKTLHLQLLCANNVHVVGVYEEYLHCQLDNLLSLCVNVKVKTVVLLKQSQSVIFPFRCCIVLFSSHVRIR